MENIGSLQTTKAILDKYKLSAKISLGQNFLVDLKVIDKIIDHVDKSDDCVIVEVGPGLGALTEKLLTISKKVIAIEIDKNMVEVMEDNFKDKENFEIIHEDILKVDLKKLVTDLRKEYKDVYLVANLPYYITSDILLSVFALDDPFDQVMIMVQAEFGQRLVSAHNTKDYRPVTVIAKTFYKCNLSFNVSKNVFLPKPNITSAIVKLVRKDTKIEDKADYIKFVQLCFTQKRKTLFNNLRTEFSNEFTTSLLESAKIPLNSRPAQLDINDYIRLYGVYDETKILC